MSNSQGRLFVVATPIGNLGDLSDRARDVLRTADLIAAEDTRRTRRLLDAIGVATRMESLHAHNEARRLPGLIEKLEAGVVVALVSDAGTPLVSDPGQRLVRAAAAAGIAVSPVPGPCAAVAALSAAGLPADRFHFEGFLPARGPQRKVRLAALALNDATLVFFLSPHRLKAELRDVAEVLGDREAVLAREMSKLHETFYRGRLSELAAVPEEDPNVARGELVLVVTGADKASADTADLATTAKLLLGHVSPSVAARLLAGLSGCSRNEAYAAVQAAAKTDPGGQ